MNHGNTPQARYNRWWLGQFCRLRGDTGRFKRVAEVKLHGGKSFVYGVVELVFDDKTSRNVYTPSYTPRKEDVEVRLDPHPAPRALET